MAIKRYTAVSGDYLYKIAKEHGTSVGAIWNHELNYNHRLKRGSPEVLYPGDVLHIPVEDVVVPEPPVAPAPILPPLTDYPGLIELGPPPKVMPWERYPIGRGKGKVTPTKVVAKRLFGMPSFSELWAAHPHFPMNDKDVCNKYRGLQCAIKLGHAVHEVDSHVLRQCSGLRCGSREPGAHDGHVTSPLVLMFYLGSPRVWGPIEKYVPDDDPKRKIVDRSGIVYFEWISPEKPKRVDHIDLWWGQGGGRGLTAIPGSQYFGALKTWFVPLAD